MKRGLLGLLLLLTSTLLLAWVVLQWVVFTLAGVVPSPGGMGAAEVAFLGIHAPFVEHGALVAATILWRLFTFYLTLAGGAAVLSLLLARDRHRSEL